MWCYPWVAHTSPGTDCESRVSAHLQKGVQHSSLLEPLNREGEPKLCIAAFPPAACGHWEHCLNPRAKPCWDSLLCQRIIFVNTNTSRRMELLPAQLHVLSRQGTWVQLRAGERIWETERTQLLCCILIAIFGKTHVILGLETWIIAQLQWETEETITMLQYGNILWDKEHSQTFLSPNAEIRSF